MSRAPDFGVSDAHLWAIAPNGELQPSTGWALYETRKREFKQRNPNATPAEYEAFIAALTAELDL